MTPGAPQVPREQGAHTPGPWVVVYHPPGLYPGRVHIGSPSVGHTIVDTEYPGRTTMSEADAHLIAAAPDLLEALQDAIDKSEVLGERFDFARWRDEVARPAIARAASAPRAYEESDRYEDCTKYGAASHTEGA